MGAPYESVGRGLDVKPNGLMIRLRRAWNSKPADMPKGVAHCGDWVVWKRSNAGTLLIRN